MEPSRKKLQTLAELASEAAHLAKTLKPRAEAATLVTLSGDLGAGKTAFVQAVAHALGVTEHVTSPTFVLAKTYGLTDAPFARLVHIDAYRLADGEDLRGIAFSEVMNDPENLIMLEWPEIVTDALPVADVAITLETLPDESRSLTYA